MKQRERIGIGIEVPREVRRLVIPRQDALDQRRKIERHDVELHADLLELGLKELRERIRSDAAADDEHLDLQRLLTFVEKAVAIGIEPSEGAKISQGFC